MSLFGTELKRLRKSKDLTVRGFADAIGKSAGYISRIEGRGEIPSTEFVLIVATYFQVEIELLLTLVKKDQLAKTESEITQKHQTTIQLFRKRKPR